MLEVGLLSTSNSDSQLLVQKSSHIIYTLYFNYIFCSMNSSLTIGCLLFALAALYGVNGQRARKYSYCLTVWLSSIYLPIDNMCLVISMICISSKISLSNVLSQFIHNNILHFHRIWSTASTSAMSIWLSCRHLWYLYWILCWMLLSLPTSSLQTIWLLSL